tara:strand:- start:3 stop:590 length:588 start_codon:yes stop_codon:yes gene_type:complete
MTSVVEICNSALNSLGASNITALTEDSRNARLCNQRYEPLRDAIFRTHYWNCLIKRVELAADSDAPAYEFTKQYTLPSDCMRIMQIGGFHNGSSSMLDNGQTFKVEGRKIVTDEEEIFLTYLAKITDPQQYDSLLIETIAARLAAELCYAVTQSNTLAAQLETIYQNKLREARFVDATEGTPYDVDASTFINSRF